MEDIHLEAMENIHLEALEGIYSMEWWIELKADGLLQSLEKYMHCLERE